MNDHPGKETFRPMNEDKYVGDINKIQIRSSWEIMEDRVWPP